MKGPHKSATFSFPGPPSRFHWEMHRLPQGHRYRVVKRFVDADGDEHEVGAEWEFICTMFDRQSDELSICVRQDDGTEWQISLIWTPEAQQSIINGFKSFVTPVENA